MAIAVAMPANGSMCALIYREGTDLHAACLSDVLSFTFRTDQNLTLATLAADTATKFLITPVAVEPGPFCAAFEPCGVLALSIVPDATAFTSWMGSQRSTL